MSRRTNPDFSDREQDREDHLRSLTDSGEQIPIDDYRRRSRRAFLTFGAASLVGVAGFRRLQARPTDGNIPDVLRRGLEWNESVWQRLERSGADARTFDADQIDDLRVNGTIGLDTAVEPDAGSDWSITLIGLGGGELAPVTVADLAELEVHEMTWEHKCIEGWSTIVSWTGVRFSDVVERFAADQTDWDHVSLRTPDERYYVGMDRFTMLHSQTLLAWELNGEALTSDHGAPVRLVTPLKYGIKQLKRVGTIEFTSDRPDDYWVERGYDYHAGF